jgi:hypothetical protein
MKTFTEFVRESTPETMYHDAQEIKRQKMHLIDKAKEYEDQANREKLFGQGGAAQAKGETMVAAAKNINKGK